MAKCTECDGTGLIPITKDGKAIPGAFYYCSCHQDGPEINVHALAERGEPLFDFPCSQTFRDFYEAEYYGRTYPASDSHVLERRQETEVVHRHIHYQSERKVVLNEPKQSEGKAEGIDV